MGLLLSALTTSHVFAAGDHEERSYTQISLGSSDSLNDLPTFTKSGITSQLSENQNQLPRHQQNRLAKDKQCKVGQPHAHRECKNNLVSVPNSNPSRNHERYAWRRWSQRMRDVRSKHNQQRSGGTGSDGKQLNKVSSMLS